MSQALVSLALSAAALGLSTSAAVAQVFVAPPAGSDTLVGLWATESTFGPALRGELNVVRVGSTWRATLASVESRFQVKGDSIRFSFAGPLGEFRGTFTDRGRAIAGFWIQPAGEIYRNAHASPLTLRLASQDHWRGEVVPLDDRFSLYLTVWRNPAGTLVASFRNPELNLQPTPGGAPTFRVSRVSDSVVFTIPADGTDPEERYPAVFDSARHQIVVWWPSLERTLVLTPRRAELAVGLFPRAPRGLEYSYRAPSSENDGWSTARAQSVGFDEAGLEKLVQRIADTVPTISRAPLVHSLLIARHGKLVLEEYFAGHDRERVHDTRSAGKTFASVMLGAAMLRGLPITPESTVYSLLAREGSVANADARKQRITVANLLTHSSGLACDDDDEKSPGYEDAMQMQRQQPDWWKYTLDLPMKWDPGTYYAYCSGVMNLVGGAITAATKTWLPDFFDKTIARPLQFGRYYYNLMPTLEGYTGGGVFIRPRDLLKIGQTYLDGGVWHGQRVVPASWVTRSTSKQIEWPYRSQNVSAGADGYAWHLNTLQSGGKTYREYEANGNGGQLLMVVPDLDLVVVFTAGNYMNGGVWGRFRDVLLANVIIPAISR